MNNLTNVAADKAVITGSKKSYSTESRDALRWTWTWCVWCCIVLQWTSVHTPDPSLAPAGSSSLVDWTSVRGSDWNRSPACSRGPPTLTECKHSTSQKSDIIIFIICDIFLFRCEPIRTCHWCQSTFTSWRTFHFCFMHHQNKHEKVFPQLTLSFCFSVSRLLLSSRSYRVTRTFFSQSLMRRGNSFSSLSTQGSMSAGWKHVNVEVSHHTNV